MREFELISWEEMKAFVGSRLLSIQYREDDRNYFLKAADNWFKVECVLNKTADVAEVSEFESSYKAEGNKKILTTTKTAALDNPEDFRFRGMTTAWTEVTAGSTVDIDMLPSASEERYVDGGQIIGENIPGGTQCSFHVVFGGVIVETFVPSWTVKVGTGLTELNAYPAKIPPGAIMRFTITNPGSNTLGVAVNYRLHKRGI